MKTSVSASALQVHTVRSLFLPKEYFGLDQEVMRLRARRAREALGNKAFILGHHYQRDEVMEFADARGDSLKLCQIGAKQIEASYLIFCGVHFMAESADILRSNNQVVTLPDLNAGCPMADMANPVHVEAAWKRIQEIIPGQVTPVTYMNSAAVLKGFCGSEGGIVCTSSNATKIFTWAFTQKPKMLFFPDEHLGKNIARMLKISKDKLVTWDWRKEDGGLTEQQIEQADIILWKGYCPVHNQFRAEDAADWRNIESGINIIVHPECAPDVVAEADFVGSTEHIINTITAAPAGSKWAVGTESHLVNRLARENPDKKVFILRRKLCACSMMDRISLAHLLWNLESLANGTVVNQVSVSGEIKSNAKLALQRMLLVSSLNSL